MEDSFALCKYLVASSIAATVSRVFCHPLDTMKVTFQHSKMIPFTPTRLYGGFFFSCFSAIPCLSLFLSSYEYTRLFLNTNKEPSLSERIKTHIISAGIAEVPRLRFYRLGYFWYAMDTLRSGKTAFTGFPRKKSDKVGAYIVNLRIIKEIYQVNKMKGFFRGYLYSLISFVPSSALYFTIFEELNRCSAHPTYFSLLGNSFFSALISSIATSPLDLLKTRRQFANISCKSSTLVINSLSVFKMRGMLVNALLRALWNVPSVTISLATYEFIKLQK